MQGNHHKGCSPSDVITRNSFQARSPIHRLLDLTSPCLFLSVWQVKFTVLGLPSHFNFLGNECRTRSTASGNKACHVTIAFYHPLTGAMPLPGLCTITQSLLDQELAHSFPPDSETARKYSARHKMRKRTIELG